MSGRDLALWEVRTAGAKGQGVFATRPITSGTVIMVEAPAFTVSFPSTENIILQEFLKLDKSIQDRLLDLHEGPASKFIRIFWANSFANPDRQGTSVNPNISRVNQSCAPNASMCGEDETRTGSSLRSELIACKDIGKDEEISICYVSCFEGLPARFRALRTMHQYGLICSCQICASPPTLLTLSDARRSIIGALERALKGYKPDGFRWLERSQAAFPKGYPDIRDEGQLFDLLDRPLSVSAKTAYNFLLGVCRKVAGSGMEYACVDYTRAGLLLLH